MLDAVLLLRDQLMDSLLVSGGLSEMELQMKPGGGGRVGSSQRGSDSVMLMLVCWLSDGL